MTRLCVSLMAGSLAMPLAVGAADAATYASGAAASTVKLAVTGVAKANASVAQVSGTAPAAYDNTGSVATIGQNFALVSGPVVSANDTLSSGIATTEAFSAGNSATGMANLAKVSTTLSSQALGALVPTTALGLTADALGSTTTAGYGANGLYFNSASTITNLGLTGTVLTGLGIDVGAFANATANTVALAVAGLTVTLNEQKQIFSGSDIFAQTNAVHIALNNYALAGGLVTGDVILGHSEASAAVPEPGTWATFVAGFGLIGGAMRRRRTSLSFA